MKVGCGYYFVGNMLLGGMSEGFGFDFKYYINRMWRCVFIVLLLGLGYFWFLVIFYISLSDR